MIRDITSKYLASLQEDASPTRSPLKQRNRELKPSKLESPDLEDMARQMNLETPRPMQGRFDTPSATVSSFKKSDKNEDSPAYEYLCRVQAVKNWLEQVLGEEIPQTAAELVAYVQNGIHLAKLANLFLPSQKPVFADDSRLQFRHTENINRFFLLLRFLEIPSLLHFELTDLYDAKDVPKVFFCLHAMSFKINALGEYPHIENLVGKVSFSPADLRVATRALQGHNLPNFASTDSYDLASPGNNTYMSETLGSPVTKGRNSPVLRAKNSPVSPHEDNPFLERAKVPSLRPRAGSFDSSGSFASAVGSSTLSVDKSNKYYAPGIEHHISNIVKLQALAKGSILRYDMFVKKIMIRSYDLEMTHFFSKIRGNLSRLRTVHVNRADLVLFEDEIVALQAAARSLLLKTRSGFSMVPEQEVLVLKIQSVARGALARAKTAAIRRKLALSESSVTSLQSVARMRAKSKILNVVIEKKELLELEMVSVQALCRRKLFQSSQRSSMVKSLAGQNSKITEVQALLRGALSRNKIRRQLATLSRNKPNIMELQTVARGAILRTRLCNQVLITLLGEDVKINELFAKVRGNQVRRSVQAARALSVQTVHAVTQLQAKFRGILVRYQNYIDLEDVYESVEEIIGLQAVIRAREQVRKQKRLSEHYQKNIDLVIRAQLILKTKYEQSAYKLFIQMKNPPIKVIRRFAGLLVDDGRDYEEQKQLYDMKEKIIETCRHNEDLELQIESIDKKLVLLDKNKISIEEFSRNPGKNAARASASTQRMSALNPSCQRRLELYLQLFYFLQTNPVYWTRIYEKSDPANKQDNAELEELKHHIMSIFAVPKNSTKSREEYFFTKLVADVMQKDFRYSQSVTDITKLRRTFWLDFLVEYNNHSAQRLVLKRLLGDSVQRLVDEDVDEVNFESNPLEIWAELRKKDIDIYGSSLRKEKVSPQEAIQDSEVNKHFVENLMNLRDFTQEVVNRLAESATQVPLHMRVLMKKSYEFSRIEYPNSRDFVHLLVPGVIFAKYYVNNLLLFPGNFGIHVLHMVLENNLRALSRVILQVFSMKPFHDNFMKPLNDFVMGCTAQVQALLKEMLNVGEIETEYGMNDWKDLVGEKPTLTMKLSDMILVEKMLTRHFHAIIPNLDDQLYLIINELSEKNAIDDYVTLTEMGSFTLSLVPKTKEDSLSDFKRELLFAQAKRHLLFILRVQNIDGNDLLELLIQAITPEHEHRFQAILSEQKASDEAYPMTAFQHPLLNLPNLSYKELKKMTLKTLLQLEAAGLITRANSYQELLNQIVVDIKTKDLQRVVRAQQLVFAAETLSKLDEKGRVLKSQLKDYNKHVEVMLKEVQRKPKDRKLFNVIPIFSKQYFYHRQLKRTNRLPTFGSYKYSLKKLMDQGIVQDVGGALYNKTAGASKCEFMFSCFTAGEFVIEVANGPVTIPGACTTITLDQLLAQQYENHKEWLMFEGMVSFNLAAFSALIFHKFYDIAK